ncbi:unnamed protein product [Oncorhynchus mykiss]|uniref:Uncharacterized protein n=1 Tax=Oncorhynchus mykiss TaxID=8022 RepID=A0A060XIS0_ONCMY|nr:unnamed protein product [Oncorhynchus mykiss]
MRPLSQAGAVNHTRRGGPRHKKTGGHCCSEFPDLLKHNNCKASHIIPSLAYGQCYPDRIGQPWAPLHKDCWHGSRRRGVLSGWITTACVTWMPAMYRMIGMSMDISIEMSLHQPPS